jgi:hypothetical protein
VVVLIRILVSYVLLGRNLVRVHEKIQKLNHKNLKEKIQKLNHKNLKDQAKLPHVMSDQILLYMSRFRNGLALCINHYIFPIAYINFNIYMIF